MIPSLFAPASRLAGLTMLAGVRRHLPILLASGDAEPLTGAVALIRLLGQRYREASILDVTVMLYPAARYKSLNETNCDEVTADIVT